MPPALAGEAGEKQFTEAKFSAIGHDAGNAKIVPVGVHVND